MGQREPALGGQAAPGGHPCWGAITLSGIYYLCLLPFRASLVGTHPLVSVLLNGSTEAIVSAAAFASKGHGSSGGAADLGIIGTMKFDIIYWWAGRLWGERVIQMFSGRGKRSQKFVARVNRSGRWLTWPAVRALAVPADPERARLRGGGLDRDELGDVPHPGRDRLAGAGPGCWRAWGGRWGRARSTWRRKYPSTGCGSRSPSWCLWWPHKCGVQGHGARCTAKCTCIWPCGCMRLCGKMCSASITRMALDAPRGCHELDPAAHPHARARCRRRAATGRITT